MRAATLVVATVAVPCWSLRSKVLFPGLPVAHSPTHGRAGGPANPEGHRRRPRSTLVRASDWGESSWEDGKAPGDEEEDSSSGGSNQWDVWSSDDDAGQKPDPGASAGADANAEADPADDLQRMIRTEKMLDVAGKMTEVAFLQDEQSKDGEKLELMAQGRSAEEIAVIQQSRDPTAAAAVSEDDVLKMARKAEAAPAPADAGPLSDDDVLAMARGGGGSGLMEKFQEVTASGDAAFGQMLSVPKAGEVASHSLVETDDEGEPFMAKFVYVDEHTCIGCTNCACVAEQTFMMEPEYGRARVFMQGGNSDALVREAISTCPVDCIHYVPWEELVELEKARDSPDAPPINFKARLVGNEGIASSGSDRAAMAPRISSDGGLRCNNCPSRGCANCPMFGVGNSPYYIEKRKKAREARRKRQREKERLAAEEAGQSDEAEL